MDKNELLKALERIFEEHRICNEAVKESKVPHGLEGLVAGALAGALSAKLQRLFDPKD